MRRAGGFTLIELIVVIGIIGLLVGTSVPAFVSYAQQARMKSTVREVLGLVSMARQQAISTRQNRTIAINTASREMVIEETLHEAEPKRVRLADAVDVTVESADDPDASTWRFVFQPSGALAGRSVRLIIASRGKRQAIRITGPTGAVGLE